MGVFHVFYIVYMVSNCAMHLICLEGSPKSKYAHLNHETFGPKLPAHSQFPLVCPDSNLYWLRALSWQKTSNNSKHKKADYESAYSFARIISWINQQQVVHRIKKLP